MFKSRDKKKYSIFEKVEYYSCRANDKSLSAGQRKYAKDFLREHDAIKLASRCPQEEYYSKSNKVAASVNKPKNLYCVEVGHGDDLFLEDGSEVFEISAYTRSEARAIAKERYEKKHRLERGFSVAHDGPWYEGKG